MGSNRPKNFRRRGDDGGDEIDGKVATPSSKPTSTLSSSKPKTLSASAPKKKLLSFADDEEEEEDGAPRVTIKPKNGRDRVKSSSRLGVSGSSHRHSSTKERRPASSNVLPQAGSYSKEALLELQKNTRTLPYSRSSANAEPKVVLKGLIKPPQDHEQQSLKDVVKQVSDLDFDEEGEEEQHEDAFADQAAIIRAKKERMRQSRSAPAPDYISLDGGIVNHSAVEGVSDEDADFQGIFVGPRPQKDDKKGVFDFGDENPTAKETTTSSIYEDEDEEDKLWEEEQFKKGIGKRMDEGSHRTVTSNGIGVPLHSKQQTLPQQQPQMYAYHAGTPMPNVSVAPTIGPATSVDTLPMSQQAELAKKALKDNVKKLKVLLYELGFFISMNLLPSRRVLLVFSVFVCC
jgi:GC-rich sequence DNA-binding factor